MELALMVTVAVPLVLTLVGFTEQVVESSEEDTVQVRVTVPVKPVPGEMVIFAVFDVPCKIVSVLGEEAIWKSALGGTEPPHASARAEASTEPSPVTWS